MAQTSSAPTQWPIGNLKPHPRQAALIGDVSASELAALAADMAANGLRHPIEILPNGVIVGGHQRWRAAQSLGWSTITAIVRHDLAKARSSVVETQLISDNVLRRQLSPLALARCIYRLTELEQSRNRYSLSCTTVTKGKTAVGARLGLSARSVNRYFALLRAPRAVQIACDRGEISVVRAGQIALLPSDTQKRVAQRIAKGEPVACVVGETLARSRNGDDVNAAFARMTRALRHEMPMLSGQFESIDRAHLELNREFLEAGANFLSEMLRLVGADRECDPEGHCVRS